MKKCVIEEEPLCIDTSRKSRNNIYIYPLYPLYPFLSISIHLYPLSCLANVQSSPRPGPNLWVMLCFVLTFLGCFGLLFLACLAFKKSAKKRAVDIETEEEVPVLTSAPHPPIAPRELHFAHPMRPMSPMPMEPVTIQRTLPVTAVTAVTYRIEPKRVPVQPEPSEPVASGV